MGNIAYIRLNGHSIVLLYVKGNIKFTRDIG